MKFYDINKRFTEIVTEYISKGYIFNTATMGGSQGEIGKVDLTDGTEIIRIMVSDFSDRRADTEGIEIIIGKSTDNVAPHSNETMQTIWDSRLEVIHSERFYRIGRWRNDFFSTEEDAKEATELMRQRYRNREIRKPQYIPSPKAMEIAKRIVREKMGYKRINADAIKLEKSDRGYTVSYRGNSYRLH